MGFFAEGKLKKIAVSGGAAVALGNSIHSLGGSWGEDGSIVAAMGSMGELWKIPSAGGPRLRVTQTGEADAENSHRWPQILPGGEAVLFTAGNAGAIEETAAVVVQSLKDKRRKVLRRGGYYGRYLPSGQLLWIERGTLFAVRFDPATWELTGTPAPVVEDVASAPGLRVAPFDCSCTGTFIYASGKAAGSTRSLMWLDGTGKLDPLPAKPGNYAAASLSPDGKRLALIRTGDQGLWVYEWQRDIMNRLTVTPDWDASPVWSPGGSHIALRSGRVIHWIRADGSGTPKRLTDSKNPQNPFSFSPDGKRLAFLEFSEETIMDIWTVPLAGGDTDDPRPGKPELFLRTGFNEWGPAFSPDGRWLAYASNESGRFPKGGVRWQVSSGGGAWTVWSR